MTNDKVLLKILELDVCGLKIPTVSEDKSKELLRVIKDSLNCIVLDLREAIGEMK